MVQHFNAVSAKKPLPATGEQILKRKTGAKLGKKMV